METIRQEAGKVVNQVRGFAAAHPKATVAGAATLGGAVAIGVASTKIGMAVLAVTGVVVAAGVGVGVGRVLGEALVRQSLEYIPSAPVNTPLA